MASIRPCREDERENSWPIYPALADPALDRVVDALADAIAGTAA